MSDASEQLPLGDLTSLHVHRAVEGDQGSRGWLVEHFTPVLLMQARYRLKKPLSNFYDPEDLVQDVWTVALPSLPRLEARDGRLTPVLVKYLSTTLLYRVNKITRTYIRRGAQWMQKSQGDGEDQPPTLGQLPQEITSILSEIDRREAMDRVHQCLERLRPTDREVIVLRGIEQLPNLRVAEMLNERPTTIAMRYRRALDRLRAELPDSVFSELSGDSEDSM